MHEVSLVSALFDQVDDHLRTYARAAVVLVRVRIGTLAGVEPELFRTAFALLRADRGHPSAELEVVVEPALWRCPLCTQGLGLGEPLVCPRCAEPLELGQGQSLYLDHLELEVEDV